MILNLEKENERLARELAKADIYRLQLTSCGNSIASGYSMSSETKPLLLRNDTLKAKLRKEYITLRTNHFSRFENNNDENVFEWLITNASQYEMNQFAVCDDYYMPKPARKLTEEELDTFYPTTTDEKDQKMADIITAKKDKTANIVIYNGATGSFLDNNTRHGKMNHRLVHGIKRDCTSIEAIMKFIQITNRRYQNNTQVYLCGAPNAGKLPISSIFINRKLRKIAASYANVVYVPPINRKCIYQMDDHKYTFDIHYNASDYEQFNAKIIASIADNFRITQAMIELDRAVLNRSRSAELSMQKETEEESMSHTSQMLDELTNRFSQEEQNKFLQRAHGYLKDRSPYDFYYISDKNVSHQVKKYIKNRTNK